jgi:hypothetical protein
LNGLASMYPLSFWLFGFKLKILKHFKQIRSHLNDYIELSSIPSEAVLRMFFMQALLLSPRAYFFVAPNPPNPFCRPEPTFLSPRGVSRGVPRHLRASGGQGGKCRPERSEGSLGTCAPREGNVAPSEARGPSALAPRDDRVGNVAPRGACAPQEDIPGRRNEVRDAVPNAASLSLGTTE